MIPVPEDIDSTNIRYPRLVFAHALYRTWRSKLTLRNLISNILIYKLRAPLYTGLLNSISEDSIHPWVRKNFDRTIFYVRLYLWATLEEHQWRRIRPYIRNDNRASSITVDVATHFLSWIAIDCMMQFWLWVLATGFALAKYFFYYSWGFFFFTLPMMVYYAGLVIWKAITFTYQWARNKVCRIRSIK